MITQTLAKTTPRNTFLPVVSRWIRRWHRKNCHYRIASRWKVPGNRESVSDIFLRLDSMSSWWPQFLNVRPLEDGDHLARGKKVSVMTKGFLPYRLRFEFRVTEVEYPKFFSIDARGDFNGHGRGWLSQEGGQAVIHFDWNLEVGKPMLRWWSWLFRPLFIANHRWLMAQGETGLRNTLLNQEVTTVLAA